MLHILRLECRALHIITPRMAMRRDTDNGFPGAWMKIYSGWCPSGNGPALHPSHSSCKIKILQDLKSGQSFVLAFVRTVLVTSLTCSGPNQLTLMRRREQVEFISPDLKALRRESPESGLLKLGFRE